MTDVSVEELHSTVVGTADAAGGGDGEPPPPPGVAEERWAEARRRVEWLARRICAEDFDD